MNKVILAVLFFATSAWAQVDTAQIEKFKKESSGLQNAIDDAVGSIVSGRSVLESTKATYLEGYGAVFTLEASLEPTRTPFTSPKPPAEVRAAVNERRKAITQKLEAILKKGADAMQSIGATESVTVVLYLINSNPADVPDLPSQILFTVKKQDPAQVIIRAF
jgi:hypothetical protein